jgi:hypothetical protein
VSQCGFQGPAQSDDFLMNSALRRRLAMFGDWFFVSVNAVFLYSAGGDFDRPMFPKNATQCMRDRWC